jgi:hypothetical protein
MFRPTPVIIRCLKLLVETAVFPFCDSNIRCVVPSTRYSICNLYYYLLLVFLHIECVNVPDGYLLCTSTYFMVLGVSHCCAVCLDFEHID